MTTVTIDGVKFNALSTQVGIATHHDDNGLPLMGTLKFTADIVIDIHDTENMPFATLQNLFSMANGVTKDKIKPIKIECWKDENRQDAVCTYSFNGWISKFLTVSGTGANHELHIHIQPALDSKNFIDLKMGN